MSKPTEQINDAQAVMRDLSIDIVSIAKLLKEVVVKLETLDEMGVEVDIRTRFNSNTDRGELEDLATGFEHAKVSGVISIALEEL